MTLSIFYIIFYVLYVITSIRFFLHTGVLAFPIPKPKKYKRQKNDDFILIQYPIRNEPKSVIERFFKSLYSIPEKERHRFLLQVLDDYDTKMTWRFPSPIKVVYLKRKVRTGNKAGNLNYGLKLAPKKYKWVMVYDSDHELNGNKIAKAVEILKANKNICCVQSRWIFRNIDNTWASYLQQQVIGVHLDREQPFRSRWDLYPIFNGAGAVWNREIVEKECGGWLERCVCEDTDISGVMNMRGYKIHVMPEWTTKIDNVDIWKEYCKQQRRWIRGNGQQIQYHSRDKQGWSLKKVYWLSWNLGFALAFTKYLTPFVMVGKFFNVWSFNFIDYLGMYPHIFAWIGSCLTWDNRFKFKGIFLYPLHYILELRVLHWQILGFWEGFFDYKKDFVFDVTKKSEVKNES